MSKHKLIRAASLLTVILSVAMPANAQSVTLPIIDVQSSAVGKENPADSSHQSKAIFLMHSGQLEEAAREAETALAEAQKGDNKQVVASCYSVLGKVYRRQNRYAESLDYYQKALDYWQKQPKPDYIVALILNNMGEEYKSMGSLEKALAVLLDAKSKMSADQASYCAIVENLGTVYFLQNNFEQAEKNWKEAVDAARKGYDRRSEVDSMSGLSVLYSKHGTKDRAKAMIDETIEKVTAYFGSSDQRLTNLKRLKTQIEVVQNNKDATEFIKHMSAGAVANQKGDAAAAEASYLAAVKESEKFGENFEGLPIALNNLATAYGQQEKFAQAVPIYERAIREIEKTAGSKSIKLAEPLNALGIALASQNKFVAAEPVMKRALPLLEQTLPASSPRLEQSKKLYKFLQIKNGKAPNSSPNSGPKEWQSLMAAGSSAMDKGNFVQAVSSYKSALTIIEKSQPKSGLMARTLSLLGVAYLRAGSFKQAESTLTRAIPMCKQYHPTDVQAVSLLQKALAVAKDKQQSVKLLTN